MNTVGISVGNPTKCPICNKVYEGRTNKRYCSESCRQKAHYRSKGNFPTAPATESFTEPLPVPRTYPTEFSLSEVKEVRKLLKKSESDFSPVDFVYFRRCLPTDCEMSVVAKYCSMMMEYTSGSLRWFELKGYRQLEERIARAEIRFYP